MLQMLASAVGTVVSVLVAVLAVGIVIAVVVLHAVRKKQGKGGCDCDCSGCPGFHACHSHTDPKQKKS